MPNTIMYTLNVSFTSSQLALLQATTSYLVVAKPTSGGSTPNVAWLSINPLQSNTITWQENYGIYASSIAMSNGAQILQLSSVPVPATPAMLYVLDSDGAIDPPTNGGTPNAFSLQNEYVNSLGYMTVGLYQAANVNGTSIANNAVSAAAVIEGETAVMTPFTTIYIWIQSEVQGNTVVTEITSPMTPLLYGNGVNTISVSYQGGDNPFVQSGGVVSAKSVVGKTIIPVKKK